MIEVFWPKEKYTEWVSFNPIRSVSDRPRPKKVYLHVFYFVMSIEKRRFCVGNIRGRGIIRSG